ncbi:MAG TPA: transposase [Candidatus Olsenella avistercoris]|nr:transposase [Candidatus Olsenella avistercoris]
MEKHQAGCRIARHGRRHYTEVFKRETAERAIASGEPVKACARKLGIPPSTLGDWIKQLGRVSEESPAGCGEASAVAELRRRVAELEDENAFLTRMVDYLMGKGV